jgi:dienelactone hydrolase
VIGPAEFGLPHLDTAMRRARLALFAALVAGAAPAAEPAALRIAAHPLERAAGGPAELDAALRPAAGPGPHPAVVLLHGCAGMRGADGAIRARDAQWGELLAGLGFVVLHVDSFAPRGETAICAQRDDSRRIRVSAERARDAYAALAYLQTRPDIRPDAVALMGWSNGGGATLWALGRDSRARPPGLAHDFAAGVALYPGCRSLSLRREAWRPVAPVLLLVGEADDWTPAPPCAVLAARAGGAVELRLYPGAYHDFDAPGLEPRRRRGVGATPDGTAMLGTDPAARADALRRVPDFLARLAPPR